MSEERTPGPGIDDATHLYCTRIVARLAQLLGDRLVGVWLFGSGVLGDFTPGRSDLDIQAVCAEPLGTPEKDAIVERLSHPALPCPPTVRGLELVLYSWDAVHASGPSLAFEVNLNTGPQMRQHVAFAATEEPEFWFVIDVAIGRRHGLALAGPPAHRVFAPLPRSRVLAALERSLRWHTENREKGGDSNTVLNAARAWRWAVEGTWSGKTQAAEWALERLPEELAAAVRHALAARRGQPASLERELVAPLLRLVLAALHDTPGPPER